MLQLRYIDGYRANQSVQDKAWVADNGYSLVKTHNAVLDALDCIYVLPLDNPLPCSFTGWP